MHNGSGVIQRVLFINDTYDDNNLGCKATTNALYELIREHLFNFEIVDTLKLYHTERSEIINEIPKSVEYFDEKCDELLYRNINGALCFELEKIKRCDIVLINGEGSIYKDVVKGRYQLFIAYLAKKYLFKKVYIVNHSADVTMIEEIAKKVYSIIDGVVVREPYSKRELESIGIKQVLLAPDAVFKYSLPDSKVFLDMLPLNFDYRRKFIIIGGTSLNNPIYEKWFGSWDRNSFINMIKTIRNHTGVQIMLADVGGDDFLRSFDTLEGVFYSKFNYRDYMLLSSYSLLHLSGRHHGACLAAISGCPLIGLTANTHKIEGDFELLNWQLPVFSFYKIDEELEEIIQIVIKVIKNNNYYRNLMRQNVEKIRNDVIKNVEIVSAN